MRLVHKKSHILIFWSNKITHITQTFQKALVDKLSRSKTWKHFRTRENKLYRNLSGFKFPNAATQVRAKENKAATHRLRVAKCSAAAMCVPSPQVCLQMQTDERVSCGCEDDSPAAANALQMADPGAGLRHNRPAGGALRSANAPRSAAAAEIRRPTWQMLRRQQQVAVCRSTDSTPPDGPLSAQMSTFSRPLIRGVGFLGLVSATNCKPAAIKGWL